MRLHVVCRKVHLPHTKAQLKRDKARNCQMSNFGRGLPLPTLADKSLCAACFPNSAKAEMRRLVGGGWTQVGCPSVNRGTGRRKMVGWNFSLSLRSVIKWGRLRQIL